MSILRFRNLGLIVICGILAACDMTGSAGPSTEERAQAHQLADSGSVTAATAFTSLFRNMDNQPLPGGNDPEIRELEDAHATFEEALSLDPSASVARLGRGVTGLALASHRCATALGLVSADGQSSSESPMARLLRPSSAIRPLTVGSPLARLASSAQEASGLEALIEARDTVERVLLPAVDRALTDLEAAFADRNFRLAVHIDDEDSLIIGRADLGVAVAALRSARVYLVWTLSTGLPAPLSGSWSWWETLQTLDVDQPPTTAAERAAWAHFQSQLAVGSPFLRVRTGWESRRAALPAELRRVASTLHQAVELASTPGVEGLVVLNQEQAEILKAFADTLDAAMNRPLTLPLTVDEVCTSGEYWTSCRTERGARTQVDFRRILTLTDAKVFLPRFTWNESSNWMRDGVLTLNGPSGSRTVTAMDTIGSILELEGVLTWQDPTFGGILPAMQSSAHVIELLHEMDTFEAASEPGISFLGRVLGQLDTF